MNQFTCQACDVEYEIDTDSEATALFCPFCGSKLEYDDEDLFEDDDEEDWSLDP